MSKRKIHVIYNSELDKQELYSEAKQEIKNIYNEIKQSDFYKIEESDENKLKLLKIFKKFDNEDNYFRILFLLSVYCTYLHKVKHKMKHKLDIRKLSNLNKECFKKHNFVILDTDNSYKLIFRDLITFFNTDSNNIEEITGDMLQHFNNIEVELIKNNQ